MGTSSSREVEIEESLFVGELEDLDIEEGGEEGDEEDEEGGEEDGEGDDDAGEGDDDGEEDGE